MQAMADSYQVETANRPRLAVGQDLLLRVDVVPVSLVLAQAAGRNRPGVDLIRPPG